MKKGSYTKSQRNAIIKFCMKYSTNTETKIDESVGTSKPLTTAQKARLQELSQKFDTMMCRA